MKPIAPLRAVLGADSLEHPRIRMNGLPGHVIGRELRVCAAGRVKKLKRLLFFNREAQVIDIK